MLIKHFDPITDMSDLIRITKFRTEELRTKHKSTETQYPLLTFAVSNLFVTNHEELGWEYLIGVLLHVPLLASYRSN